MHSRERGVDILFARLFDHFRNARLDRQLTQALGHRHAQAECPVRTHGDGAAGDAELGLIRQAIRTERKIAIDRAKAAGNSATAERLQLKMTDNLVRLAVGIEDADDIIADLQHALTATAKEK